MPLIEWIIVRLDVSGNEWRRHNKDMEPQRRGSVPPLHTRKRNRTLGLRKTTLGSRVHVQPVGLNAETKKGSAPTRRGDVSLDNPLYRTFPISSRSRQLAMVCVDNPRWPDGRKPRQVNEGFLLSYCCTVNVMVMLWLTGEDPEPLAKSVTLCCPTNGDGVGAGVG